MSAGGPALKGSLRGTLLSLGGLALLGFLGLPVAQVASGLAFVAFAIGALCLVVGLNDAAKAFWGPFLFLLFVSMAAPMVESQLQGMWADPRLQRLALVLVGLALLAGIVLLLAKAAAHPKDKPVLVKPTFRRRTPVTDPEPVTATPTRPGHQQGPSTTEAHESDDLGLFGGGRHARR